MISSRDTIEYNEFGFDSARYESLQKDAILERIDRFRNGRLYLEIGGKFLYDPHAARVLPGFDAKVKPTLFSSMQSILDLIFCVNARDIKSNRQLHSDGVSYTDACKKMAADLGNAIGVKPKISINMCEKDTAHEVTTFIAEMKTDGYECYKRYMIDGYPENTANVISENGYGADDYIETDKKLVLVVGAASNSGKMSTCLGQLYQEEQRGFESGYAKYETFPIWSLPISHPVNLAYEAATVDIGDYNVEDHYHMEAYGKRSVNYNRDVEAFEIIKKLSEEIVTEGNFMREYKSPTDMGINFAGNAITDDEVVCVASLEEIRRRKGWYQEIIDRGHGDVSWVKKCESLENQAMKYVNERGYEA